LVDINSETAPSIGLLHGPNPVQISYALFNIFNHANFGSPNPVIFSGSSFSSSAGVITSTSTTSRQIQFALKLLF
jgi:hypothetical protein